MFFLSLPSAVTTATRATAAGVRTERYRGTACGCSRIETDTVEDLRAAGGNARFERRRRCTGDDEVTTAAARGLERKDITADRQSVPGVLAP